MDSKEILALLIAERDKINGAIDALSRKSTVVPKAGGKNAEPATIKASRTKIVRTPEQRAAQAERMRKYWAQKNQQGEASGENGGKVVKKATKKPK